jgi:4'-phosphopantetheinyl transferase
MKQRQIDIYIWKLEAGEVERERLKELLSVDEAKRAARFIFERDKNRFIIAHGRMRELLGRYVGIEPARLAFACSTHGKPFLAASAFERNENGKGNMPPAAAHNTIAGAGNGNGGDGGNGGNGDRRPPLFFNLSHSHDLACLAISGDFVLGVDIEKIGPVPPENIERFFSKREQDELAALKGYDRREGFFNCWVRKEAFVKAVGEGLSMPLESFSVSLAPGKPARLLHVDGQPDAPRHWRIAAFSPAPGYAGALAIASGESPLHLNLLTI